MKKTFLIAAALVTTLSPIAAQAQTRELERDRHAVRSEQNTLRDAQQHGSRNDVREARHDVREAKQEQREDWRDYRQSHRNVFKGSRFNAPFRYRSVGVGARLDAGLYGPRYQIGNYATCRLPAPGKNLRYVRHYNDLLLVNIRSGSVVRVYRSFYW